MAALETTDNKIIYTGDGVVVEFAFPFLFYENGDLKVYLKDTESSDASVLQTIVTEYTIGADDAGNSEGGTVTMVTAPTSTESLIIEREVDEDQESTYTNYTRFPAPTVEKGLNRLTMMIQQHSEELARSLKFENDVDSDTVSALIEGTLVAGYQPRLNSDLTGMEWAEVVDGSNISLPTGLKFMVQTASGVFSAIELLVGAGLTITSGDGQDGDTLIELPLTVRAQDTPDDTVYVTAGTTGNSTDATGAANTIAANAASGLSFPVVTADSRIDLLKELNGVFSIVSGTQAASPVPPAYPGDGNILAEITIDELVTVIIDPADIDPKTPYIATRAAAGIGLTDTAGHTTETDVEGAIAELYVQQDTAPITASSVVGSRATGAGTGTQTEAHGITGTPRFVDVHYSNGGINGGSGSGSCFRTGTSTFEQGCTGFSGTTVTRARILGDTIMFESDNGFSNTYVGVITAMDSTNVTITWTSTGSPASITLDFVLVFRL